MPIGWPNCSRSWRAATARSTARSAAPSDLRRRRRPGRGTCCAPAPGRRGGPRREQSRRSCRGSTSTSCSAEPAGHVDGTELDGVERRRWRRRSPGRRTGAWRPATSPRPGRGPCPGGRVARMAATTVPGRSPSAVEVGLGEQPAERRRVGELAALGAEDGERGRRGVRVVEVAEEVPPAERVEGRGPASPARSAWVGARRGTRRRLGRPRCTSRQPQDLLGDGLELHLLGAAVDGDDPGEEVLLAQDARPRRPATPTARSGSAASTQSCDRLLGRAQQQLRCRRPGARAATPAAWAIEPGVAGRRSPRRGRAARRRAPSRRGRRPCVERSRGAAGTGSSGGTRRTCPARG